MTETGVGSGVLNRPAARFVAIGLFLMAFFTALWASWSLYGLSAFLAVALIVIFGAFAVIFVINGVQLFRSAAGLPLPVGAEAQRRGRILQVGSGSPSQAREWSSSSSARCWRSMTATRTSHRQSR
jgi:hypothetical protein